jgi:hypothetical protein
MRSATGDEMATRQENINELAQVMFEETRQPMAAILAALGNLTDQELEGALAEYEHKETEKQLVRSTRAVEADLRAMKYEEAERQYFANAAEQLRIADNEANFRLVHDSWIRVNGQALSWSMISEIKSLIAQGALQFSSASEEDQQRWADQDLTTLAAFVVDGLRGHQIGRYITSRPLFETFDAPNRKQHVEWMKNLGLDRLNEIAAVIQQNQAVKRQAGYRATPAVVPVDGYAPLPEATADGKKIDKAYLLDLSRADRSSPKWELFRQMCRKHGVNNLTARLQ